MNTVRTYIGDVKLGPGTEFTKEELSQRVEILTDMLQALLDYMEKQKGKNLGIINIESHHGIKYVVYEGNIIVDPSNMTPNEALGKVEMVHIADNPPGLEK